MTTLPVLLLSSTILLLCYNISPINSQATVTAHCDNYGEILHSHGGAFTLDAQRTDPGTWNTPIIATISGISSSTIIRVICHDEAHTGGFIAQVTYLGQDYYSTNPLTSGYWSVISAEIGSTSSLQYYQVGSGPWGGCCSLMNSNAYWVWNGIGGDTMTFDLDMGLLPMFTTAEPTTTTTTTTTTSTTAEPTTAEPTTAEPTTAEPTTAEPTTAEPTTAEPTTAEPTTTTTESVTTTSSSTSTTPKATTTRTESTSTSEKEREQEVKEPSTTEADDDEDEDQSDDGMNKESLGVLPFGNLVVIISVMIALFVCLLCVCVLMVFKFLVSRKKAGEIEDNVKSEAGYDTNVTNVVFSGEKAAVVEQAEGPQKQANVLVTPNVVYNVNGNQLNDVASNVNNGNRGNVVYGVNDNNMNYVNGDNMNYVNDDNMKHVNEGNHSTSSLYSSSNNKEMETRGANVEDQVQKGEDVEANENVVNDVVSVCSDCGLSKNGKTYDTDGMFYCWECWKCYED